jgi:hypothetical protein
MNFIKTGKMEYTVFSGTPELGPVKDVIKFLPAHVSFSSDGEVVSIPYRNSANLPTLADAGKSEANAEEFIRNYGEKFHGVALFFMVMFG